MIIIGEKLNGTRKAVAAAIRERDAEFIKNLAKEQDEGGSTFLDVNAGTAPDREPEDMVWMVNLIQEVSDLPLCLDSANPAAIKAGLGAVNKTPMINSVSGEQARIDGVLPLALEHKTDLILLALNDKGIPATVEGRMEIIRQLIGMARDGGLEDEKLYIDPLVIAISTGTNNAMVTYDTIKTITQEFPKVHITGGASNISFGMPLRPLINRYFMAMAVQAGLDSAIINPNDRELKGAIMTSEMLMGRDKFCMSFNKAFRAGLIGPKPEK
ncbi:Methionine synthase [Desulfatibacillum aliphaticivorans]|uniref:Methionine synthase n=1 Tax=Desulfatibacillum aliphaticivorans TaxID=218208 RepID=B8FDF5_DESAL|nr:dihydropteroate synthase [Desulfatibacillum aliphaticivorans]ACL06586.1 Methionine synthase [Desulfatibacillum aliphaticivorans]